MTEEYCPRNELQKDGSGILELGNVPSSKPTKIQEEICMAYNLMDQVVRAKAAKNVDNKRKWDDNQRGNSGQQNKRTPVPATVQKTSMTCFECGVKGHFKSKFSKLKNQYRGNQIGRGGARRRAFVIRGGEARQDPNIVMGTFLLNNRYAFVLFDMGTDRSFGSTAFSLLINIAPTSLDVKYTIELDDGKLIGANTIIRGCTLNLLNHPFNIDLMLIYFGSFDIIKHIDWLSKYHAVIVCDEKLVCYHQLRFWDEDIPKIASSTRYDAIWFNQRTDGIHGYDELGLKTVPEQVCNCVHRRHSNLLTEQGRARRAPKVNLGTT
ncbi:hypothetical protein Tco_1227421 [Tanacetum coccineum]